MSEPRPNPRYRFGVFEADVATGELRRKGLRVKLHAQPFQVLCMLLAQPGEMLTREQISRELWPEGTFVDYEHGVNSAINRLREALGDKAASPRFVETLARRGYRFVAPVEMVESAAGMMPPAAADESSAAVILEPGAGTPERSPQRMPERRLGRMLAAQEDLPRSSHRLVRTLFLLLQAMYLSFYVGALANLAEINELLTPLAWATQAFVLLVASAALLIPARVFLLCGVLFRAPGMRGKFLKLWPLLLAADVLWSLAPFLLLHHMSYGLALACTTLLVYAPFAQRSLALMGAADQQQSVLA